ncbi:MAG TPA: cytochrome c [Bacteroidales bacterium]|nr:cytochrome c [Bacteroidales bacterium]
MRSFITIVFLLVAGISVSGQEWTVPADKQGKLSPFRFSGESVKSGEKLYGINCKSCHGTPGMGNFQANLKPQPPDPATDKLQNNSDGELYYKISTGRGPMPAFKNSLSPNDLWTLISYLRTFRKGYVQSVAPIIRSSAYPGAEIVIALSGGPGNNRITMKVTAVSEKSVVPVKGAGVRLFVNRTFGRMMPDEEKTTDRDGLAVFSLPAGFPADTAGNLRLSAGFTDEDLFGAIVKDTVLKAGTKIVPVSLTHDRAMWNVVRKAPWWILLTYTFGVLGVWGFIILIMLRLRDIFIIGEHLTDKKKSEDSHS